MMDVRPPPSFMLASTRNPHLDAKRVEVPAYKEEGGGQSQSLSPWSSVPVVGERPAPDEKPAVLVRDAALVQLEKDSTVSTSSEQSSEESLSTITSSDVNHQSSSPVTVPSSSAKNHHTFPCSCLKVKTQEQSEQQPYITSTATAAASSSSNAIVARGATTSQQTNKHVGFATVTISSHAMCLGDSPSVSAGPPVQLDWTCLETVTASLDAYEESSSMQQRRQRPEMQMPAHVRQTILMQAGYSRPELQAAATEAQKIQKRILKSSRDSNGNPWSRLRQAVRGGSMRKTKDSRTAKKTKASAVVV